MVRLWDLGDREGFDSEKGRGGRAGPVVVGMVPKDILFGSSMVLELKRNKKVKLQLWRVGE